jgi:hypothetical protein
LNSELNFSLFTIQALTPLLNDFFGTPGLRQTPGNGIDDHAVPKIIGIPSIRPDRIRSHNVDMGKDFQAQDI